MKLHLNHQLFKEAIQFTAQEMKMREVYIEKDYWMTCALRAIFADVNISKEAVFKGGTALAKCFGIIERFSEDIDLVVLRTSNDTDNSLKKKIKAISKAVTNLLPEMEIAEITNKKGMIRKTAHSYKKEFVGSYGQVRDIVIVEASWLGNSEPYESSLVSSYIFQMMENNNQLQLAKEYNMLPFSVNVLKPERTLCEKIMSLVRFSYDANPVVALKNKIRHCYDLNQLLCLKRFQDFLASSEFDTMLLKVANDDFRGYRRNNQWLLNHPSQALIFDKLEEIWVNLQLTYNDAFKYLVFGTLPSDESVLKTMLTIKERLGVVTWQIFE